MTQNCPKNDSKYSHGSKSCNEPQTFLESAQQYFRTSAIVKKRVFVAKIPLFGSYLVVLKFGA